MELKVGDKVRINKVLTVIELREDGFVFAEHEHFSFGLKQDWYTPIDTSPVIQNADAPSDTFAQQVEEKSSCKPASLSQQVGGSHYKDMAIQPIEYITKNKLDFPQGCIVKYISRYRNKNKDQDVRKVIHFAKLILQLEYGYTDEQIRDL